MTKITVYKIWFGNAKCSQPDKMSEANAHTTGVSMDRPTPDQASTPALTDTMLHEIETAVKAALQRIAEYGEAPRSPSSPETFCVTSAEITALLYEFAHTVIMRIHGHVGAAYERENKEA